MYKVILEKTPCDKQLSPRYYPLFIYQRILEGKLYDCFQHQYHTQYVGIGASERYVPESQRAPSTNTGMNLMRSVVEESVSFLFGEDRFPDVKCDDKGACEFIEAAIADTRLVHVLQEAAIKGSIGSVAVQIRVLNDRFFPMVHYTTFLTPTFDPQCPDRLIKIVEKKKVLGRDLQDSGYQIDLIDMDAWFWFQRVWDENVEQWYLPWPVNSESDFVPSIDLDRSVKHKLGLVPWVWIKNLPGGNDIDGLCTFESAIENAVQIDYLMSRADSALKYNADPLTLVKTRNPGQMADFIKSDGNIMTVGVEGDAKILEISGDAAHSIIDTVKELKDEALHSIHSNRADPSKLAVSHSSVVQRFLYLPTVQLASALRLSYGEFGIVLILQMMMQIASQMPIKIRGKFMQVDDPDVPLTLLWPDWFPATPFDMQTEAATITALVTNGLMSKEEALRQLNKYFNYEDAANELSKIEADQQDLLERQLKLAQAGQKPQTGENQTTTNIRTP
jgi:hypothetical protein